MSVAHGSRLSKQDNQLVKKSIRETRMNLRVGQGQGLQNQAGVAQAKNVVCMSCWSRFNHNPEIEEQLAVQDFRELGMIEALCHRTEVRRKLGQLEKRNRKEQTNN
jgi:hypothetical protein